MKKEKGVVELFASGLSSIRRAQQSSARSRFKSAVIGALEEAMWVVIEEVPELSKQEKRSAGIEAFIELIDVKLEEL